jgi:predicted Zn-dependent protease
MAKLSKGQEPPQWMSTHPANETRIEKLKANLPEAKKLYNKARKAGKKPGCEPPPTSAKK